MASGKDLTRLATLAGMAYIANKMGDKDKGDSGSMRAARPESTETRAAPEAPTADESTKSDVLKAITAKREAPNDEAPSEGVIDTPAPAKPKRAAANTTASKYPSGVMGGTRPTPSTSSSSEEGMKNYKPRRSVSPTTSKETPAPTAKSGEDKSWWTTPNENLKQGKLPSGKEFRAALGSKYAKGGSVKKMASGGMTASKRADGIASRGKTKCKMY